MAVEYRRFTKTDWYGYAGAEKFADGSQPFMASVDFEDGAGAIIISDANGIGIDLYRADTDENKELGIDVYDPVSFMREKQADKLPESSLIAEAELRELLKAVDLQPTVFDLVYELLHPQYEAFKGFERVN